MAILKTNKLKEFAETGDISRRLKEKSVHGVLYFVAGGGFDFVIRLISTYFLARLLPPEAFGLVAMVTAVTVLADVFRDLGLSTATIQAREINHAQVSNLLWINVAAGCALTVAVCVASPILVWFYSEPRVFAVGCAMSLTFFLGGLGVQHQALLSRQLRQGRMALVRLSAGLISTILAVGMALTEFGYWALVWREVTRALLVTVGMWICCRWVPSWPKRNIDLHGFLRFGSHMTLTNFIITAIMHSDRLIIGKFFGPSALGLFRQAQQLVMAPIDQLNGPISNISQPGLSMLQADPDRYRRYYGKILFLIGLLTMPVGLFFVIYAKEVTLFMLGPSWVAATPFMATFGCVAIIRPVIATTSNVLISCGRSKTMLNLAVLHSLVLIIFMIIGIHWGAIGVVISHVATTYLLAFPKLLYSFRDTPISLRLFGQTLLSPLVASLVLAFALLALRLLTPNISSRYSLLAAASLSIVVYPATLLAWPRSRGEIRSLAADVYGALVRS